MILLERRINELLLPDFVSSESRNINIKPTILLSTIGECHGFEKNQASYKFLKTQIDKKE